MRIAITRDGSSQNVGFGKPARANSWGARARCFLLVERRFSEGAESFFLATDCFSGIADRFLVLPEQYCSIAGRLFSINGNEFSISENYFAIAAHFSSTDWY